MTTEHIIQLITVLLGSGGLIALFLLSEKKAKAQLENIKNLVDQWQGLVSQLQTSIESAKKENVELAELYRIQFEINTKLRKEIDEKNTRIAVLSLLRCKKLKCIEREPPYGSGIIEIKDPDSQTNDKP